MRQGIRWAAALVAGALPAVSAVAATVTIGFSGALSTSTISGLPGGAAFTGVATYRTDATAFPVGANFRDWSLDPGAFTIDFGALGQGASGDGTTVPLGFVERTAFGALEMGGQLQSTGILNGRSAFIFFEGSADTVFDTLPYPFPTDFTNFRIFMSDVVGVNNTASGSFRITSITEVPDPQTGTVPEPASLPLLAAALLALRLARRA